MSCSDTSWSTDSPYRHWVATLSRGFTLSNVVLPKPKKALALENLGYSTKCKTTRYCVVLVEMRLKLRNQEKVLKPALQDTAHMHDLGRNTSQTTDSENGNVLKPGLFIRQ